ncbi:MAG: cytochrome c553 [Paraglaciecola sp.]|jgi:cytochrome c553
MKKIFLLNVVAMAMLSAVQAHGGENLAGETLYKNVCKNCHGPTARGMASFPKLSGNTAEFLEMRLKQYRAGEKLGPNTALMQPVAAVMSDEEIVTVAAYISTSFK